MHGPGVQQLDLAEIQAQRPVWTDFVRCPLHHTFIADVLQELQFYPFSSTQCRSHETAENATPTDELMLLRVERELPAAVRVAVCHPRRYDVPCGLAGVYELRSLEASLEGTKPVHAFFQG